MKTYYIIYKNNKFYDTATRKRIYPKDDGQFVIAGDNDSFGEYDILNQPHEILFDSAQQLNEVKEIKNLNKYIRILPANTSLYFDFRITKTKHDNEQKNYAFRLELLEDLYLHSCTTWKDIKLPELHHCRRVVIKDLVGNVEYFEPIYATSINEAYSKTRQFYFPNQGTPRASVYVVMKYDNGFNEITLEKLRESHYGTYNSWECIVNK